MINDLIFGNDINDSIWNKFIIQDKFSILCSYYPNVNEFIEIKTSTMQRIILSLYEEEYSIKDIIYCLKSNKRITDKYSLYQIKKFVIDNTKFFLYWGIINPVFN